MAVEIRRVDYFYATVTHRPGEAYKLLSQLAAGEVNLLAFSFVPVGPERAQLTLFPDNVENLASVAERNALVLDGPHPALLVQGDDKLGALADVHGRLFAAKINIFASSGVTDGKGSFGYVVYVQPQDIDHATAALGV